MREQRGGDTNRVFHDAAFNYVFGEGGEVAFPFEGWDAVFAAGFVVGFEGDFFEVVPV